MRRWASAALIAGTLLPLLSCTAGRIREPEMTGLPRLKAVQLLVMESADPSALAQEMRAYRDQGYNAVVLRSFHLAGDRPHPMAGEAAGHREGVYFPTSLAPVLADVVTPFVQAAHREGLLAFGWMVTRRALFGSGELPADTLYDPASGAFTPQQALDVLHPGARPYLEGLFADLARTGVDGILLQDDLASRMGEGFTPGNLERYRLDSGTDTPPWRELSWVTGDDGRRYLRAGEGFAPWVEWKTARLVELARALEEACRRVNPRLDLALNLTYEAVTDPDNGRLWLSQDIARALEEGPSYSALMLYHRQAGQELGRGLQDTLQLMEGALDSLAGRLEQRFRVVVKFQTVDWSTGERIPGEDLAAAILAAWGGGWSLALIPPPSPGQAALIRPLIREM